MSRLKERYDKEVIPALKKEFGYTNGTKRKWPRP